MHITNRHAFTWRVKRPAIYALLLLTFYIGLFTNIYCYGFPITLFVALLPVGAILWIIDTIKEGDY